MYFEFVREEQNKCYFLNGDYLPSNYQIGDQCMKKWFQEKRYLYYVSEVNGLMLTSFSEFLAFLPYLLRSLRMQLMFCARDIYIQNDKMPKRKIELWSEKSLLIIMIGIISLYTAIVYIVHYTDKYAALSVYPYRISSILRDDGQFYAMNNTDYFTLGCF